jgi:hypothetical protein
LALAFDLFSFALGLFRTQLRLHLALLLGASPLQLLADRLVP